MKKFKSCGNCQDGWRYRSDKSGDETAIKCSCLVNYQQEELIKIRLEKANINLKIVNLNISADYVGEDGLGHLPKLIKYVDEFKEKFHSISLYFWSEQNSTQKTTLASIIGRDLILQGFKVKFILMDTLIKLLQDASFNEDKEKLLLGYTNSDLLIIDDCFDKAKMTVYKSGYQFAFIDSFLRHRLEVATKATIFTSNISPQTISKSFNISIEKLINRNVCPMEFIDSIELRNDFDPNNIWE